MVKRAGSARVVEALSSSKSLAALLADRWQDTTENSVAVAGRQKKKKKSGAVRFSGRADQRLRSSPAFANGVTKKTDDRRVNHLA